MKFLAMLALAVSLPAMAAKPSPDKPVPLETEEQKTLYALGVLISRNLEDFQLSPAEFNLVKSGLIDGFNQRASQVDLAAAAPKVQQLQRERAALLTQQRQKDGQAYLDKAAALPGAEKTGSGLVIVPIRAGSGASPSRSDRVTVNYEGKLVDGTVFDSSIARGQPATFGLTGVIPCWSEALQLMKVGGKSRVVCPPGLAYGERGAPKIRPQSTLDFEVELLEIAAPPPASAPASPVPPPPARQAAPPPTQ
jgi:FKBP-type peptidyl-prolyl cis-trans isomerase FkpA/FKBP-type peptidyl-prolyl cis-trans isomerase FklB